MRRSIKPLLALLAPIALTFCGDNVTLNSVAPPLNVLVDMLDQCDSASFNAALGAGTCTTKGSVPYAQFTADLAANHSVGQWTFDPATLDLSVGGTITVTNRGGEVHTFTRVAEFGGGIVPAINAAAGYTAVAPECLNITDVDRLRPGTSMTTLPEIASGTQKFQCCIHPWMRSTVTVGFP